MSAEAARRRHREHPEAQGRVVWEPQHQAQTRGGIRRNPPGRSCLGGTSEAAEDLSCMDIPLLVIGALLILTLTAFFTGFLPYPIGWIILIAAFIGRLLFLKVQ